MNETPTTAPARDADEVKQPYVKPAIERVDLALDETMSAGCKLAGTSCWEDDFTFISEPGS